jgi:HEAT repeat protein
LAETQMNAGRVDSLLLVTAVSGLAECERCGNTEDVILRALRSVADPETKRRLILSVGEGRSRHARVIEYFAQAIAKEEGKVRLAAVLALGNYGPAAKAALPALTALLEMAEGDEELEQAAGSALKRILSPE